MTKPRLIIFRNNTFLPALNLIEITTLTKIDRGSKTHVSLILPLLWIEAIDYLPRKIKPRDR